MAYSNNAQPSSYNVNGCSPAQAPGQETYEVYYDRISKKDRCQYDYRHIDGELFTCIKSTLADCRRARDQWLDKKEEK